VNPTNISDATRHAAQLLADMATPDVALGARTTYRVGGLGALGVVLASANDVGRLSAVVQATGVRVLVLGNGSNLLVDDRGFDGVVVTLGEWGRQLEIDADSCRVLAGGAVLLPVAARRISAAGVGGFEWAVGVPGSMGGAVRMNAGGHGSDMEAAVVEVEIADLVTGEVTWRRAADLGFSFRHSALADTDVVIRVRLQLHRGDAAVSAEMLSEIVQWRRDHQPGGQNCGSVFVNPRPESAGALIEAAGWRGVRQGRVEVSAKHANFVVADPDATADDVLAVMRAVRRSVLEHTGIGLRTEVRLAGVDEAVVRELSHAFRSDEGRS
jgi:UDP-N-acetylmuramate dehydrogenase